MDRGRFPRELMHLTLESICEVALKSALLVVRPDGLVAAECRESVN